MSIAIRSSKDKTILPKRLIEFTDKVKPVKSIKKNTKEEEL